MFRDMSAPLYALGALAFLAVFQLLLTRYRKHLRAIPGPILASFSNLWKIAAVYHDDMPGWNNEAHDKYGPVVRIGPNHISFASPEAFQAIYASRQYPKTKFYEVGAPVYSGAPLENMFSLRDVQQHHVLRKNIGHLYTKTAVKDLEPRIDTCVDDFIREISHHTKDGPTTLNMSIWLHLYAYECLSEVNMSKKLGFIKQGQDVRQLIEAADKIFFLVGIFTQAPALHWLLGFLRSLQPAEDAEPVLRYTIDEVEARKKDPASYMDLLAKFLQINQEQPDKLSHRDIIAAVFINLTAGHDVLAITLRAIFYHLARNPRVLNKMREEIQTACADLPSSQQLPFSTASQLPYLNAVIQEVLRVHPNTGTIIERVTPGEGATIDGYFIPGGTVVGINAWVLHRNKAIFGEDADVFRPERWLEDNEKKMKMDKYILSFGAGSHSCVGRHMAMIMIIKVVVEYYRRFDATLANPGDGWKIHGGWVTKQTGMDMILNKLQPIAG